MPLNVLLVFLKLYLHPFKRCSHYMYVHIYIYIYVCPNTFLSSACAHRNQMSNCTAPSRRLVVLRFSKFIEIDVFSSGTTRLMPLDNDKIK